MRIDIRHMEELSMNAWPALRQVFHDGWVLRFADGYTGRANSVHPLYDGTRDVEAKLQFCRRRYARVGIPLLFRMTEAARPTGLDDHLERLNFRAFNHASVQVKELPADDATDAAVGDARGSETRTDAWTETVARFKAISPRQATTLAAILDHLTSPAYFATVYEGGEPVACGLAVAEDGWAGLFDIVTREDRRGRGHGSDLVRHLLGWARRQGATRAYLQVMLHNAPALRLYERLGFREAYQYWYRAAPR
jgi:ribosomal protein S18 acetylase RimI-like enzyme